MSWKLLAVLIFSACCGTDGFTARQMVYPGQREFFELSIIHLNDFHARFVQTSPESNTCHKNKEHECVGGLGRVATVSRELLEERPNAIFLNAGDQYQGTIWYNVHKWNATVHFLNRLPRQDALTLGNHEFDDGVAGLVPFLRRINAPVLVTNIDDSEEPTMRGLYKNSTVIVRGNRKIGVIGVLTKTTITSSKPGKLKFLDEVESVNAEAARLKAKGVDIIIVLSHVGLDVDRKLAANCLEVDVIVGGHSHTFLYSGKPPFIDNPEDEYPVVVKQNTTDRTVLIVQAAAFTKYLGNLTVWFNGQGEVVDWEGNPVLLENSIEEDPKIIEELKPWAEAVNAFGNKVVGETKGFLNSTCSSNECTMANFITDAMVHAYRSKAETADSWTFAAIGCINAGGIRTHIAPGEITFGDLATVLPFEHTWDTVELKGQDLYDALEESASHGHDKDTFGHNGFLQWSGVRVVYNMTKPAWSRIQCLSVRCQDCKVPRYEPLNRDKWYRVIVVSYILKRGDGLTVIADGYRNLKLGPLDVSALQEYIESISPFAYQLDRRLQIIS